MNFKKRLHFLLLFLLLVPNIVFAYSNNIILGGNSVGIKVNTRYVMIVGFYKVDGRYIGEDAGLNIGDYITKINDIEVSSIDEMVNIINNIGESNNIKITFIHDNYEKDTILNLIKDENNVLKTGLYVKDTISGIGTLTYIDPNSLVFGALGHEISDKNTLKSVEISNGTIFQSLITGIIPSSNGNPGSKEAKLYTNINYGNIYSNSVSGIFGTIKEDIFDNDMIEVGTLDDVKLGTATIRTVIDTSKVEEFEINIINIDKDNPTKNILFEITDQRLLDKTGGVVAGMSGSPIIQNNKIIGAVTHVVVNEPKKGYGIFITTMLEEGDRVAN